MALMRTTYIAPTMEEARRDAEAGMLMTFRWTQNRRPLINFMNPGEDVHPDMALDWDLLFGRNLLIGIPGIRRRKAGGASGDHRPARTHDLYGYALHTPLQGNAQHRAFRRQGHAPLPKSGSAPTHPRLVTPSQFLRHSGPRAGIQMWGDDSNPLSLYRPLYNRHSRP